MGTGYFNWKLAVVLLLGFIVLAATAFGLRQWQKNRMAQSGFVMGNAAYNEHKWDEAAKQLGRYLSFAPNDVSASLKYAEAQLNIRPVRQGNIQQAVGAYRNVLRTEPNNVEAASRLCEIYMGLNMPAEAELIASRTLKSGESFELRKALVVSLIGQRKYNEATGQLKSIIEKNPHQVAAYELLGKLVEQRPKEFAEDPAVIFDRAVEINPDSAEALIARAAFFLRQGRADKAMSDLQKAQQLDLSDVHIRLRLAEQLLNAGELENASRHLEIAGQKQPENNFLWVLWARLALQSGSKDTMTEVADRALKSLTTQPWDFMPLAAEIFIRAGRFDRAQECISKMQQNEIAPAERAFLEGLLAENQGRLQDSIKYWRQAIGLGLNTPAVKISLANALSRAGDSQSGITVLRTLISEHPDLFIAHMAIAQLLVNSGRLSEAEQHIHQARQIYPDNNDAALMEAKIKLLLLAGKDENVDLSQYRQIHAIADKLGPTVDAKLLRFNLAIQQNDLTAARKLIDELKSEYPSELRVVLAESDFYAASNKTEEAVALLKKANVMFPRTPAIIKHLSVLLVAQGRLEECEKIIKEAFDSETQLFAKKEFGLMLSDIYSRMGRNNERYTFLNSLAEMMTDDIAVQRELLNCEELSRDTTVALKIVDKIRSIEGENGWQWRYEQARIWIDSNDFKNKYPQIVSLLQANLLANPDDVTSRMLLGLACEKAGDYRLAVSTYTEALARAPRNVRLMAQAATAFYRAGEYDKVDDILRQAAREHLYHPDLERLEVQWAMRRGNLALAGEILEKMLERDPNNLLTGLSLVMLKIRQNNLPAAQHLVQKLRAEDPNSLSAAEAMVELNLRMGKPEEALEVCNEMVGRLNNVPAHLLRAKTLAILKSFDRAKEDFNTAIVLEPNNIDARVAKIAFHYSIGENDQAVRNIQHAMSIMPANLQLQKAAVAIYLSSDDKMLHKEGESILEAAIAANPGDIELGLQKAKLLLSKNTAPKIEQASRILQSITERRPQVRDAWLLLAGMALRENRPDKVIDACLRGLTYNPGDRALLLLKARAEAKMSPELALPTMRMLWELDPNNTDAVISLAEAYVAVAKYDSAIKFLSGQMVFGDLSRQRKIKTSLAAVLYKSGDKIQAEKIFDELSQSEPNDPNLLLTKIRLYRDDNLSERLQQLVDVSCLAYCDKPRTVILIFEELIKSRNSYIIGIAEKFLDCVLKRRPDCEEVLIRLGSLLQDTGRWQEAASIYHKVLELKPDNIVAINNLAWILCEHQNKAADALELVAKGLEESPENIDLIDTRGMVLYRLGRYDSAIEDFENCIRLYPGRSPGLTASYFHLGKCLAKLGEKNKAIINLNKAIELNKTNGGLTDGDIAETNYLMELLTGGDK